MYNQIEKEVQRVQQPVLPAPSVPAPIARPPSMETILQEEKEEAKRRLNFSFSSFLNHF